MRIAFSSQPIYSHLVPIVLPAAAQAAQAGHEVVVLTSPKLADEVRRFGLRPLVLPNAISPLDLPSRPDLIERIGLDPSATADFGKRTLRTSPEQFSWLFVGPLAHNIATGAIDALRDWKPELIVGECTDYGSYYTAEVLDVPHAVLDIAPLAPFDEHPDTLVQINDQRAAFGLSAISDSRHPFQRRQICFVPASFYPPRTRAAAARYYQPPRPVAGQRLDPAIAALPDDRPLVLATLGTNAGRLHETDRCLLDTIVEVLADLPVTGVVALGTAPENWRGARPDNVHLTSFVQQRLLLPTCDAFITHGGFSGVREALGSGTPMVVLPMFAEQPANAARVTELGTGLHLNIEDTTHHTLRDAVRAVLDDPGHRRRAQQIHREFLALPPFSDIVTELEELVDQPAALAP